MVDAIRYEFLPWNNSHATSDIEPSLRGRNGTLAVQFLNIKNVHFYMQRGYDDYQILIVRIC